METVIEPRVKIIYSGKDITQDISEYLLSVDYTDNTSDASDEISFSVEDTEGLWRCSWMPEKGDKVQMLIGYDHEMLDCGTFTVDEIEMSGPPDIVSIRALASSINSPLRTKYSKAYEKQTLRQIANEIANKYGYKVVDNNSDKNALDDIKIDRITQSRETDLAFLKRIADDYGIMFSVKDTNLVFSSIYDIEKMEPSGEIDRKELISYSVKDKATSVYKEANVKHKSSKTNKVVESNVPTKFMYEGESGPDTKSKDTLEVRVKAEDKSQAEKKARAKLHKANSKEKEGSFTLIGDPYFVAGNNFTLTGMGRLSGVWNILKSTHKIDRSGGYTTDIDAKLIKPGSGKGTRAVIGEVLFDTDSAVLRSEGLPEIDKVVAFMKENINEVIEVAGHTDSDASSSYNQSLSDRRSKAVVDYMVSKGILETRLVAKGYGESSPVASNGTSTGKQKNRRTEFVSANDEPC